MTQAPKAEKADPKKMAIDPKQIDADLTLELDKDEITASEFTGALEHFIGLVKEVTRSVTARRKNANELSIRENQRGS